MTPRATYRLQCHKDFGFEDIERLAGYFARLGISHIYASPWLKARSGSLHGYDIVDHHSLNPELGDTAAFEHMIAALDAKGIGRILDFVPNHMGVGGSDNPLWLDVLEWGRDSNYAGWFDIDWLPERFSLRDKVLVPLLAKQYGMELYDGKLALKFDAAEGSFAVWAYDVHKLPICPLSYQRILGDIHPELERLGDLFAAIREWHPQTPRRAQDLKGQLAAAAREHAGLREAIDGAIHHFNGIPGVKDTWTNLHLLIQEQHWRAADFRVAADDINYRRFFDNNELAGLRMELPDVFDHAHELVFRLSKEGKLNGLRIDHIDGLLDPKNYLRQLRSAAGDSFYLIVEKILAFHEGLRDDWPVDGTTGYEFLNLALSLLVDPDGENGITACYTEFTGKRRAFAEIVRDSKMRIMRNELGSELNVLAREAARVAWERPETADFTWNVLRRAIREIVSCFPVYRIYVDEEDALTSEDRRDLTWAMKQARFGDNGIDPSVFDFLEALLSGDLVAKGRSGFSRHAVLRCAMKLQQYSGPVMAKGLEDTAFYQYNRFIALNEVGGYPDHFGTTIANFHKTVTQRARFWPHSMLATSTHDTKRGEDTRARLAVLSEIPEQWAKQVRVWSHVLRARRGDIEAAGPPDRNDEYLLYQLLLGSWPPGIALQDGFNEAALRNYTERLKQAMRKSIREAKVHSTWARPNAEYEDAVLAFIDGALDPHESQAFFAAFLPFQQQVARLGVENSLVQTVLKLTAPGVPDIYQGAELWDFSLVDPDNRRPVDFRHRKRLLDDLDAHKPSIRDLTERWQDGALKLFVISRTLRFRAANPDLFERGGYEALLSAGPKAECICGYARIDGNRAALVIVARFPARRKANPEWHDTSLAIPPQLASATFRNIFTGKRLCARDVEVALDLVFDVLPVAVFEME
ncbi:MAG TPA: malto-oligosyltrehalose synthase [Bryobacteraceae bacterium]|nr:malto-oligosyltrehalose synthase [Bryobacteraceae bacterium]